MKTERDKEHSEEQEKKHASEQVVEQMHYCHIEL